MASAVGLAQVTVGVGPASLINGADEPSNLPNGGGGLLNSARSVSKAIHHVAVFNNSRLLASQSSSLTASRYNYD
jgi:hypothetical protein